MSAMQPTPSLTFPALRMLAFAALFAVLQLGWQGLRDTAAERVVVHELTVKPAVWLVNVLTPEVQAYAEGSRVRAAGGGLNILNGCEGVEALFMLCAAFAVAPLPWRARLWGLLAGIAVVFAINQARILVLFYAYRMQRHWFDPLHATIAPVAVVLLVCAYFYVWLRVSHVQPR